jgi:hypothetical protein
MPFQTLESRGDGDISQCRLHGRQIVVKYCKARRLEKYTLQVARK